MKAWRHAFGPLAQSRHSHGPAVLRPSSVIVKPAGRRQRTIQARLAPPPPSGPHSKAALIVLLVNHLNGQALLT
jgi:hypothetical protein